MKCRKGDYAVRYGEHIEVRSEEGNLLASFRATQDMCKQQLDVYLAVRHDVIVPYRLRKMK